MARDRADAMSWVRLGTDLLLRAADGLDETELDSPSLLPSWTRRHVLAHVAANAEAIGNLVRWAATGVEIPMYTSPDARLEGIGRGTRLPTGELVAWLRASAVELDDAMGGLTEDRWSQPVVTAQGRTVRATEIPWMRAREVCVHAVDLDRGVTFSDLPAEFLWALCDDVLTKRNAAPTVALTLEAHHSLWEVGGEGIATQVSGPLPEITAYLTGRPHRLTTTNDAPAPALPAWL